MVVVLHFGMHQLITYPLSDINTPRNALYAVRSS